ncbi:hypothetical protein RCL1_000541 [Eukaryota sp. TZLM3-RCL]
MLRLLFLCLFAVAFAQKEFLVWHCLERCQDDVPALLRQVKEHRDIFTEVSFELFNIGPNSTLLVDSEDEGLTDPSDFYDSMKLPAYPMISSYPPERRCVTEWTRQLIKNPQPFVDAIVNVTKRYRGIQVDIEPSWTTLEDGPGYIDFLNLLSREMHKRGKKVVVAVASWVCLSLFQLTLCHNVRFHCSR